MCMSREDVHRPGRPMAIRRLTGILKDRPTADLVSRYYYRDGDWLEFKGVRIQTLLTPGHTDGTVSFRMELTVPASGGGPDLRLRRGLRH